MAEVIWTEPALMQLEAILEFIALDKPRAARAVAARIVQTTGDLSAFVRLGRPIPEFRHPNFRQVWLRPCWIYYRFEPERAVILHVRRAETLLRMEDLLSED